MSTWQSFKHKQIDITKVLNNIPCGVYLLSSLERSNLVCKRKRLSIVISSQGNLSEFLSFPESLILKGITHSIEDTDSFIKFGYDSSIYLEVASTMKHSFVYSYSLSLLTKSIARTQLCLAFCISIGSLYSSLPVTLDLVSSRITDSIHSQEDACFVLSNLIGIKICDSDDRTYENIMKYVSHRFSVVLSFP